jgi:hypothetical protein
VLKDKGLELVAINGSDEKNVIQKYVTDNKFTFNIALAGKNAGAAYDIAEKYGVQAYPTNYLLDPTGKVLFRSVGFNEQGLRSALEKAGVK